MKRKSHDQPVVRTDAGVTVGMSSVQVGVVQTGMPVPTTGQVVVYDPSRPPSTATPVTRRDPTGGFGR